MLDHPKINKKKAIKIQNDIKVIGLNCEAKKPIKAFISHRFWIFKWFTKEKPDANDESLSSEGISLLQCCVMR